MATSTSQEQPDPPQPQTIAPQNLKNFRLKVNERVFKAMKAPELQIRPIHHRLKDRVRAHVFLCMLAHHI
ncbi:MAG: hypothetical protein ACR2IP_11935, partial [Solirubrobacteraceae bacterium]